MANDFSITITGIDETIAMLRDAPRDIAAAGFAKAGRAAGNVIQAELERRTPVDTGELKKALRVDVELDAQLRGVHVSAGFGKQGYKANWVEYGHKISRARLGKRFGNIEHYLSGKGFVPAHPFMRPAFEASAQASVDAFAESLKQTVESEYKNA